MNPTPVQPSETISPRHFQWFPELRGDEITVAFAHAVFGGIAGGTYHGLLWRNVERQTEEP